MTRIYQRRFRVRGYEVGATNRVHESVFLNFVQQAAFEASAEARYDIRRYHEMGAIWVIRKQTIAYLDSLVYGDAVDVTTWVSDFRRVRSNRECELRRASDGGVVALAQTDWVYVDVTSLFPRRIAAEMIDAFSPNGVTALESAPPLEPAEPVDGRSFVYSHRVKGYELDNLRHVNKVN
jgi:acyl-CoA thioester hydrolase